MRAVSRSVSVLALLASSALAAPSNDAYEIVGNSGVSAQQVRSSLLLLRSDSSSERARRRRSFRGRFDLRSFGLGTGLARRETRLRHSLDVPTTHSMIPAFSLFEFDSVPATTSSATSPPSLSRPLRLSATLSIVLPLSPSKNRPSLNLENDNPRIHRSSPSQQQSNDAAAEY